MTPADETADDPTPTFTRDAPIPGLLLVWTASSPRCTKHLFAPLGRALTIGREACDITLPHDAPLSRTHASLAVEGDDLIIRDLQSKHGVYLDGARIPSASTARVSLAHGAPRHVLRAGTSVFLIEPDTNRIPKDENDLYVREPDLGVDVAIAGPAVREAWATAVLAARQKQPLLVHGAPGTGKENVAKLFHKRGPRAKGPLVTLNCANLDASLAEATLFGAARGAFTGADRDRAGVFEEADGGVLFLDEIGELPLEVQAKFLRVLEYGTFRRVGGGDRKVDVLVVSATNRNLAAEVAAGRFRADLYDRIKKRRVVLPSLHDRPEEIPFLVEHLASKVDDAPRASAHFVETCLRMKWPGNIRSLDGIVGQAIASGTRGTDGAFDWAPELVEAALSAEAAIAREEYIAGGRNLKATAERLDISRNKMAQLLKEAEGEGEPSRLEEAKRWNVLPCSTNPRPRRFRATSRDGKCRGDGGYLARRSKRLPAS